MMYLIVLFGIALWILHDKTPLRILGILMAVGAMGSLMLEPIMETYRANKSDVERQNVHVPELVNTANPWKSEESKQGLLDSLKNKVGINFHSEYKFNPAIINEDGTGGKYYEIGIGDSAGYVVAFKTNEWMLEAYVFFWDSTWVIEKHVFKSASKEVADAMLMTPN